MSGALQTLIDRSERLTPGNSDPGESIRPINDLAQNAREANEGFKGDSSFDAHVASITDIMRSGSSPNHELTALRILQDLQVIDRIAISDSQGPIYHMDVDERSLPPVQQISKLLRLLQREKQRFFYDVPIIDEQEFVELCKAVCFPTEPYLLSSWIIVNVGLYYLFHGLAPRCRGELGIAAEDAQRYIHLLTSNVDAAGQNLRLCLGPSTKTCAALIMLV